ERLRRVINKAIDDKDLWEAAESAFRRGWRLLKLYFMIGLPTETNEDVDAVVDLVRELSARGRAILGGPPRIHVSLASFIPKPHTPFQWAAMAEPEMLWDKQARVRNGLARERSIEIKTHDVRQSVLEAVFSRGDRRLSEVLLAAWRAGARFDGWSDQFKPDLWQTAFAETGIEPEAYLRAIEPGAALPWDAVSTGMKPAFLRRELERALRAERTPSCEDQDCGACRGCETCLDKGPIGGDPVGAGGEPGPPLRGRISDDPVRYIVRYAKEGPARFLGHNDLVNALQRVFRRAGIETLHSAGFHPKPVMSFGPALPLGMAARDEWMEFKSGRDITEADFLAAANAAAPAGLNFLSLRRRGPAEPSCQERVRGAVYAVDLQDPAIADSAALSDAAVRIREAAAADAAFDWLEGVEDAGNGRLLLKVAFRNGKIPRPQDLVRLALGWERPSFGMTRETFVLAPV
ncbi:MAG: TIGR03936 family radical SAM-associated protein, partial [Acidobacteriota bacterium]|nr:TIGR03936 family radical SAM-associated protein [Acidobacteriota bacterium]